MTRWVGTVAALALLTVVSGGVRAQGGWQGDDTCRPEHVISFHTDSGDLDLSAESELAEAKNWVVLAPGRYLLVLAPPDRTIDQLGLVRADAVTSYLLTSGVGPRGLVMGDYSELTPSERYALGRRDPVVVLYCSGVTPVRPGWLWEAPYVLDPDPGR